MLFSDINDISGVAIDVGSLVSFLMKYKDKPSDLEGQLSRSLLCSTEVLDLCILTLYGSTRRCGAIFHPINYCT